MIRSPKHLLDAAAKAVPPIVYNVAGLGGLGSITWGAYQIYHPAGFIVGGLLSVIAATCLALADPKQTG